MISFFDRNRSIEQKVACVLIQRMTKCYSMKSRLILSTLQIFNALVTLLNTLLVNPNALATFGRYSKSEIEQKLNCHEFTHIHFVVPSQKNCGFYRVACELINRTYFCQEHNFSNTPSYALFCLSNTHS